MHSVTLPCILTLNGGSSSIRCAVYEIASTSTPHLILRGKIERLGHGDTRLVITDDDGTSTHAIAASTRTQIVDELFAWLAEQSFFNHVKAIGHRVVHGMSHTGPQRITPQLLSELQQFKTLDPEHLPFELELISAIQQRHPALPQVACFDTAFHRNMPPVAQIIPLPGRYQSMGIQRYGFHGLSYAYLLEELKRLDSKTVSNGRVILAHLGSGASLAAVRNGQCIDTSMGFTPNSGIMMSTRSGDIDPGLFSYLSKTQDLTAAEFQRLINHESGLLGISQTSADVRDLLISEKRDPRAALALAMFCYQVKKCIGAYAAALGGIDTLVFAGGIGENAAVIRQRICTDLEFLGVQLHAAHNADNASVISGNDSTVTVRVIHTDEELMIARSVCRVMDSE